MIDIYILLDYKGHFGSKNLAIPYRSGMNKDLLVKYCIRNELKPIFLDINQINFLGNAFRNKVILITSQEDQGSYYKSFLEDITLGLHNIGGNVIPKYEYIRAHNNKVFMEIYADSLGISQRPLKNVFGCFTNSQSYLESIKIPVVIKEAEGAMSRGVYLAKNKKELIKIVKKITGTKNFKFDFVDLLRSFKHKGYIRESRYRKKIILQQFIPNLTEDWKILIFGSRYYVLKRKTRKNDFRASGSGKLIFTENIPSGILNFAYSLFLKFNTPNISLDIIYDGNNFYLTEYQGIYFGSTTVEKSPFYFIKVNNDFVLKNEKSILEEVYINSISEYLNK